MVQLLICNAGLMILHLLASICIASDLARGKTHFLSERAHLARQFQELSEHMTDLLQERQKWIDALNRCKWSMDAERLKEQLAAQELQLTSRELQTAEEKLHSVKSLLSEKQNEVSEIESQISDASEELQKTVQNRDASIVECNRLQSDCAAMQTQQAELAAKAQATEYSLASKESELEQLEQEIQALATTRTECENELNHLRSELKDENANFTLQHSQQAESLANIESTIAKLKTELTSVDAALQEAKNFESELQTKNSQAQTQFDRLLLNQEQQKARLDQTIATAEAALSTKQTEVEELEKSIASLNEAKIQLEKDLAEGGEVLRDLTTKAEYAQFCNVQLINETIGLELKATQNRESMAIAEAELENVQLQFVECTSALDAMRAEELKLEMQIANLLTQAGKFDCLAVATSTSLEYAQAQQQTVLSASVADLQEQRAIAEESLREIRSQIESDTIAAKGIADQTSQLQCDAEKSVADAERRVEMLTEKAENLAEQVQTRSAELFAFKQELIELRVEVRDLEAIKLELKEVDQELEGLKLQLADQRSKIAAANAQIVECDALSQSRQLTANSIQLQISDLDTQLQNALSQHQLRTQSLEQLTLAHDAMLAENQVLIGQKSQLENAIQQALDDETLAVSQLGELRDQAQAQRDQIAQLETKRAAIESDLEIAMHQSLDAKNLAASQLGELRDQATVQSEQITQLEAERTAIECDVTDLTAKLQILLAEISQAESETERLQELLAQRIAMEEQVSSLAANIESLSHRQCVAIDMVEMHEQTVKATELQIGALQDELSDLERQHEELQASRSQAQLELTNTMQLQHATSAEYDATLQQSKAMQASICELRSQLESLSTQKNTASTTLQQVIDEVSDAQSVAKQWATYIESLKMEVESQRRIHAELQSSIDALRVGESRAMMELEQVSIEVESLLEQQANLKEINKTEESALRATQLALDEGIQQRTGLQHELSDARKLLNELESQALDANKELQRVEEAVNTAIHSQATLENQIIDRQTQLQRIASDHQGHLNSLRDLANEQSFLESSLAELNRRITTAESVLEALESRKHQLDQDLRQQQASFQYATEQRAAIDSEIAVLNAEIATLQLTKSELSKIEATCVERTETLNALCEESAMEQARLNDINEQVTATQRSLDELLGQQTSTESLNAKLEQQLSDVRQSLALAQEELQATIDSKSSVAKLIDSMSIELKQLASDKASIETQIQQIAEQLGTKASELEVTEDKVAVAEEKAVEMWSTISELQELRADLDKALAAKRDAVAQANAEMIKFDHLREAILAQHESMEVSVAALNLQSQEHQNAKHELEKEISILTAEVDRLQSEIVNANTSLELVAKKVATASILEANSDSPEMLNTREPIVAMPPTAEIAPSLEVKDQIEIATIATSASVLARSQEDDIWTSLGELTRLGNVVRVDSVIQGKTEVPRSVPFVAVEATTIPAKPSSDEWETVFAPTKAQRRA